MKASDEFPLTPSARPLAFAPLISARLRGIFCVNIFTLASTVHGTFASYSDSVTRSSPPGLRVNGSTVKRLGGTGVGGPAGGRGGEISSADGQSKMNIRREINVAYERFPSFPGPEWLQ